MLCWKLSIKGPFPSDEAVLQLDTLTMVPLAFLNATLWQHPARLAVQYHEACSALEELPSLLLFLPKATFWHKVHAVIFTDHVP